MDPPLDYVPASQTKMIDAYRNIITVYGRNDSNSSFRSFNYTVHTFTIHKNIRTLLLIYYLKYYKIVVTKIYISQ
jgi:hypothetical protein